MALHKKFALLAALNPDIAIVAECAKPERVEMQLKSFTAEGVQWVGDSETKGLAVIAFGEYRLTVDHRHDPQRKHFLPVAVEGPNRFNLLAVWAFWHRVPKSNSAANGSLVDALDHYRAYLSESPSVVAGDFNNNVRWDKPNRKGHAHCVSELSDLGLHSAYHITRKVEQGTEPEPTLYWRNRKIDGPSYHIDYCFIPSAWRAKLAGVKVGDFDAWISSSDHMPLIVDVNVNE
jgi:exodeoxyribonuclease-3